MMSASVRRRKSLPTHKPAGYHARKTCTLRIDSADIEYQVFGEWISTEMVILLVCDIGQVGTTSIWPEKSFIQLLVEKGCTVIRFNMRDSGGSTIYTSRGPTLYERLMKRFRNKVVQKEVPYTASTIAKDIEQLLFRLCVVACHVVGFGSGSLLARVFAESFPEACITLTLIGSPLEAIIPSSEIRRKLLCCKSDTRSLDAKKQKLTHPSPRDSVLAKARYLAERNRQLCTPGSTYGTATLTEVYLQALLSFKHNPACERKCPLELLESCHSRQEWCLSLLEDRNGDYTPLDVESLLQWRKPMLIVHGTNDIFVPVSDALQLASAVPASDLLLLEGVHHDLPDSHAPLVAQAIFRLICRATRSEVQTSSFDFEPKLYKFYPSFPDPISLSSQHLSNPAAGYAMPMSHCPLQTPSSSRST